jgi:hypothetical protein
VIESTASLPVRRSGGFQFRLGTLSIGIVWAGLVSLGLRSPTELWSGVIAVVTLLAVLFAVLLVIYRTDRTRAMAVGFLVFCVGYLAYLAVLAGTLSGGLRSDDTPVGAAFSVFFRAAHPPQQVYQPASDPFSGPSAPGDPFGTGATVTLFQSRFHSSHFLTICNNALACLLGVAGAIAAQVLYATRPADGRRDQTT